MNKVKNLYIVLLAAAALMLAACGDGGDQASQSDITIASESAGPTAFISIVQLTGNSLANLATLSYTISSKPGSVSKPVNVSFAASALKSRGYESATGVSLPVFGLYSGYANQVDFKLYFLDGSIQSLQRTLTTAAYSDPKGIYDHPTILVPRAAGSTLGFDFFAMKSTIEPTVIVDTDGTIRWVGTGLASSATIFADNGFYLGDPKSPTIQRVEMDGSTSSVTVQDSKVIDLHHNIDRGKQALVTEVDLGLDFESVAKEITPAGLVLNTWDMGQIIGDYMTSQGDDPSSFVRPGSDWFHMNATTYDPSDDSVILSSRENFVIKIDYATGNIIWILGDPTKYWYRFPSLRAKALQLADGGLYPIGQHAVSITSDGLLMLFNDGAQSFNQPAGEPAGASRTYSMVSAYSIDTASMTVTETWDFDYGQTLFSDICSSAYEASDKSILVDYAVTDSRTTAHLVGLDQSHSVVFDFRYPTAPCTTSWNAVPVPLDAMFFQ